MSQKKSRIHGRAGNVVWLKMRGILQAAKKNGTLVKIPTRMSILKPLYPINPSCRILQRRIPPRCSVDRYSTSLHQKYTHNQTVIYSLTSNCIAGHACIRFAWALLHSTVRQCSGWRYPLPAAHLRFRLLTARRSR